MFFTYIGSGLKAIQDVVGLQGGPQLNLGTGARLAVVTGAAATGRSSDGGTD